MAGTIYVRNIQDSPAAWLNKGQVYDSIQLAIDNAMDGDEIWVARGTYLESLVLKQNIKIFGGFEGVEYSSNERILWNLKPVSIIDGAGANRCILANFNTTIDGFTLKNGGNVDRGAGIFINNETNIEIKNIFIESCSVSWKGVGIFIETEKTGFIAIERVVVWNCDSYCGALEMDELSKSTLTVKNCTIVENRSYGLEVPIHEVDDGKGNLIPIQPGVWDHFFSNTICWRNINPYNINAPNPEFDTHDAWAWAREFIDYSYVGKNTWEDASDEDKWHGPKPNTIFEKDPDWKDEPQFVDPGNGDFRLLNYSPCLDAGMGSDDMGAYPSNEISGNATYYSLHHSVPNVSLELIDDIGESYSSLTNNNGHYFFTNILNGVSTILPSKENDQNSAVTGSDALLILQYLAFLASLTEDQQIAADVTGDENISGSDAQAILRYLAFYSTNTGNTGSWRFNPDSSIFIIQKDTTANFKAILLGDVNADWSASPIILANRKVKNPPVKVKLSAVIVGSESNITLPVRVENLSHSLHTALLTLEYDPEILAYQSTNKTDSTSSFLMAVNGEETGKIHIAMASIKGLHGDNNLVDISFRIKNNGASSRNSDLLITRAIIDDIVVEQVENAKIHFKNAARSVDSELIFTIKSYPNPFNLWTTISFHLPDEGFITASIFNIQGQHVTTLIDNELKSGDHQITWAAMNEAGVALPAGIYFFHIELQNNFSKNRKKIQVTKKLFLVK